MGLNGTHKTNITSIETALTTAINSLTAANDSSQWGTIAVLNRMRRDLELIRNERNQ